MWEPCWFSLFAWSPPLVRALISLRPLGFPVPRRFRRTTPPAFVRAPNPSGGSRPADPPLACPYPNARVYHPPVALRQPTPSTLRGPEARLGGPQTGRQHPYAGILFPIGRFPRPRTDPSYARGQGLRLSPPPCATPSGCPRGPGSSRPSHRSPDDTARLFVRLSAGPVGHRQPGSEFPRSPAVGKTMPVDDVC